MKWLAFICLWLCGVTVMLAVRVNRLDGQLGSCAIMALEASRAYDDLEAVALDYRRQLEELHQDRLPPWPAQNRRRPI